MHAIWDLEWDKASIMITFFPLLFIRFIVCVCVYRLMKLLKLNVVRQVLCKAISRFGICMMEALQLMLCGSAMYTLSVDKVRHQNETHYL